MHSFPIVVIPHSIHWFHLSLFISPSLSLSVFPFLLRQPHNTHAYHFHQFPKKMANEQKRKNQKVDLWWPLLIDEHILHKFQIFSQMTQIITAHGTVTEGSRENWKITRKRSALRFFAFTYSLALESLRLVGCPREKYVCTLMTAAAAAANVRIFKKKNFENRKKWLDERTYTKLYEFNAQSSVHTVRHCSLRTAKWKPTTDHMRA